MRFFDVRAAVLLVIGGLNWGLYGLFDFDLVASTIGGTAIAPVIYAVIGLAALYQAFALRAIQRGWNIAPVEVG